MHDHTMYQLSCARFSSTLQLISAANTASAAVSPQRLEKERESFRKAEARVEHLGTKMILDSLCDHVFMRIWVMNYAPILLKCCERSCVLCSKRADRRAQRFETWK